MALTAAALLLFGAQIWTGDGRFGGLAWLAVVGAIIAGAVGITQSVKSEAQSLKKHPALGWDEEQAREGRD